ncbi:unnamed protein product [Acanthosepion pharaonis]|uniref:Uncharacterized protein n=1 Tax=Acanthosepion pharaonis TaxID=158019 RepID=A0A812DAL8_ACAPH|nr:unnamed protein product [Sepia pharaonis]
MLRTQDIIGSFLVVFFCKKFSKQSSFTRNPTTCSLYLSIYLSIYLSYIYLSIYLYIHLSIYLYIYLSIYTYIYLSIYTYIYLSIYTYIYLSIYLYVHLSIYLYIHLSIYLYVHLSIYLYVHLSIYLYIHLSIYLYIHLYIYINKKKEHCLSISLSLSLSISLTLSLSLTFSLFLGGFFLTLHRLKVPGAQPVTSLAAPSSALCHSFHPLNISSFLDISGKNYRLSSFLLWNYLMQALCFSIISFIKRTLFTLTPRAETPSFLSELDCYSA